MTKRILTAEQVQQLLNNVNVLSCSDKTVTFKESFKLGAIKLHKEGFSAREIFDQIGIGPGMMDRERIKSCMKRWKKIVKMKGAKGLSKPKGRPKKRSGKPKKEPPSDKEKIKELKTEIAYLKEENDFLVKIRAKRAE